MIKKQLFLILLFLSVTITIFAQIPYNQRYTSSVFEEISIMSDVIYGNAPALNFPYLNENNTSPQDLLMDIYQPAGDILEFRPAIVCAHSGAFVSGSKDAEDMVAFCDSMAHNGYVTASIGYRLGMNMFSAESSTRAVYRGIQDGRTAIRYLKENAVLYGIDTNNIYLLGSSAGAYIGQHNYYMDTEDERPPETYISPDLGCLDCSGNIFNHSGKANGLVALWGALMDTNMIVNIDTLPVFLAHGTADATVPFGYGSAFGNSVFPPTYGSELVAEQIENFGNDVQTYFVPDAGHEFYGTSNGNWAGNPNAYWDTVFNKVETFYYDIHKPTAAFLVQGYGFYQFVDESISSTSWYWDFGDENYSAEQNPLHEYEEEGHYKVTQFVQNNNLSWDTISVDIDFYVGVLERENINFSIFPNPTTNRVSFYNYDNNELQIIITNTMGVKVDEFILTGLQRIDGFVVSYPKGIYIVSVIAGNRTLTKKIIIQ